MPFNNLVGLRVSRVHKDGVEIECPMRPELLNSLGTMHGGVYATVADVAAGLSILAHFHCQRKATTVELKVNYFLPIPENGLVRARCHLLRVGSTLAIGRVDLFDGYRKLAGAALVTYKLL
jgi:acyl-CoA thioesterase